MTHRAGNNSANCEHCKEFMRKVKIKKKIECNAVCHVRTDKQ